MVFSAAEFPQQYLVSHVPRKITEKISKDSTPTVSFEYFPPKTDSGMATLGKRILSMKELNPEWIDVTFGAGGSTTERTLEICEKAVKEGGLDVMMHLTCTNMGVDDIDTILEMMKKVGIRNILALRGDPPKDAIEWKQCKSGFRNAVDLVRHIRSRYGDYFCIAVAGYPEGHADCESFDLDLMYLKEKVDAGADLILTQLFYDVSLFEVFRRKVRELGVIVPIIPGVMPVLTYAGLHRMTEMCKVHLPNVISYEVEKIKDDDDKIKEYGIRLAVRMCKDLIQLGVEGIHIYTMNQEETVRAIIRGLSSFLPEKHTHWIIDSSTAS